MSFFSTNTAISETNVLDAKYINLQVTWIQYLTRAEVFSEYCSNSDTWDWFRSSISQRRPATSDFSASTSVCSRLCKQTLVMTKEISHVYKAWKNLLHRSIESNKFIQCQYCRTNMKQWHRVT